MQDLYGIQASLHLPFLREGKCVGVLTLLSRRAFAFGEAEILESHSFRDQAMIAVENARLFNETQDALERQTATAEILRVIARSPDDTQPVFDAIVASAKRLLNARAGVLTRFVDDKTHLAAFTPVEPDHDAFFAATFPRTADDPITQALHSGQTVLVNDTEADDDWGWREGAKRGIRSSVNVPLLSQGKSIGGLTVNSSDRGAFDPDDVELLRTFADQAVIAIENVRLFNETQEALAQQTATADVLKVISRSAFDLQIVLDTLVSSAATLCEAEKACIFLRRGEDYGWVSNFGFSKALVDYAATHPFQAGSGAATSPGRPRSNDGAHPGRAGRPELPSQRISAPGGLSHHAGGSPAT